jgi:hypothetical protein
VYSIDKDSLNPQDNVYTVDNERIHVINILSFLTNKPFEQNNYYTYDLRESTKKIVNPAVQSKTEKRVVTTEDWKIVPSFSPEKRKQVLDEKMVRSNANGQKLNVFSPHYARLMGIQERAVANVRIPIQRNLR